MSAMQFREYLPEDLESFHSLHDEVFPDVPLQEMARWMSRDDVTAGVAVRGGEIVGEIPLHIREFVVRPNVTLQLAFEHGVCVSEEMRGQGVGTAIQDAIRQFMTDRADVLAVYRGDERSSAYNFYDRCGLKDVCYIRHWLLPEDARITVGAGEVLPADALLARESELLEVFRDAYGHAGGYQRRAEGFYERALTHLEAVELATTFYLLVEEAGSRIEGYCILGFYGGSAGATVMEVATRKRDLACATRLLQRACTAAVENGRRLRAELHDGSVYRPVFEALGFEPQPRGEMIMASPLDLRAGARKTWIPQPELADVRVRLWTPRDEAIVHEPEGRVARTLTVELKHAQAVRWLLSRFDLESAVGREEATVLGARSGDLAALGRALPFARWEYQAIDHI